MAAAATRQARGRGDGSAARRVPAVAPTDVRTDVAVGAAGPIAPAANAALASLTASAALRAAVAARVAVARTRATRNLCTKLLRSLAAPAAASEVATAA